MLNLLSSVDATSSHAEGIFVMGLRDVCGEGIKVGLNAKKCTVCYLPPPHLDVGSGAAALFGLYWLDDLDHQYF